MIKPSVITYEVTNDGLGFHRKVDDKSLAETIDANLKKTWEFINVLNKYYKLPNDSSQSESYSRTVKGRFLYTNFGNFDGVQVDYSSTRYDNWDGRPPIHDSRKEVISAQKFYDNQLKEVIDKINKHIEACEYLSPSRGVTAMLPQSIFNLAKTEIARYKADMEVLKNYSKIK